jgi:hypothetical protein
MDWSRSTTTLAIAAGTVLGALAAIVGPTPPPAPPPNQPFKPVAQIGANPNPGADLPDASGRDSAPAATVDKAPRATPPPKSDEDIQVAALACARGDGGACLSAAAGRALAGADDRAALLRQLAVQRFAEGCQSRKPESCSELARLYREGIGVEQNLTTSEALDERVNDLCRAAPNEFCAKR